MMKFQILDIKMFKYWRLYEANSLVATTGMTNNKKKFAMSMKNTYVL